MIDLPAWMMIVIIASIYLYIVIAINHAWGARREMRALNKEMKKLQKEMKEAEKSRNKYKLSEVQAKQVTLMSEMSKLMFKSMVPMIIILPLVGIVFSYINSTYEGTYFVLPFGIPFLHESNIYTAAEFFILILIIMSFIVNSLFYRIIELNKNKNER